jgi:hypothetical protein
MREFAQIIGWAYVVFNGLALVINLFTSSPDKWLVLIMVSVLIASPGGLLIFWGRRKQSS